MSESILILIVSIFAFIVILIVLRSLFGDRLKRARFGVSPKEGFFGEFEIDTPVVRSRSRDELKLSVSESLSSPRSISEPGIESSSNESSILTPQLEQGRPSRLQVLYYVVRELASGFGVSEYSLETIKKGIIDRQILEKIWINYLNGEGKPVGRVTITIDWRKHQVYAKSDSGRSFQIDSTKSISEQVSRVYNILIGHTEELRKAFGVGEIRVRYSYTQDVWKNKKKLEEARKFLGTSPAEDLEWAQGEARAKNWDVELEYISRKLAELKIRIEHDKPR